MSDTTDNLDSALIQAKELVVRPEWIDANNHLNVAYYVRIFSSGIIALLERIGLPESDIETRRTSTFAAELNVSYKREVRLGETVRVATQLIGFDSKRIHYYHWMFQTKDGYLAATSEGLSLHVSLDTRRVCPFEEDSLLRLANLAAAQSHLPLPDNLGRRIGLKK